ncbi:MAG: helix-turn-helix domain-containing protein [Dysgonamonadaceae bacterium]|jgi:transposase|nr:helix-turn-helix domain-containing protein [Dysgonamonadaceae bacterium]
MAKERLKVTVAAEEIAGQLRRDEKFSQGVRLYAVYQIALGKKAEELQSVYNTSHKTICNWVHRFNAHGVDGLKERPRRGRPSRLGREEKAQLKQVVLSSPEEEGFSSGTWTWALVSEYIRRTFCVSYKKAQIYNILHSIGLSYQKGKGFFPEAEERVEAVSAIKKTSGTKRRQCGVV